MIYVFVSLLPQKSYLKGYSGGSGISGPAGYSIRVTIKNNARRGRLPMNSPKYRFQQRSRP
jgi:hypothetical protein